MKILKCVCLVVMLFGAVYCEEFRKTEATNLLNKMKQTDMGKNLFSTIQLELSTSSTNSHVLDKIVQLLEELKTSITSSRDKEKELKLEKENFCSSRINELTQEIQDLGQKITTGEQRIQSLSELVQSKSVDSKRKSVQIQETIEQIADLVQKDASDTARHAQSIQGHNDMLDALREARRLITKLDTSNSFLQISDNQIFAQIKSMGQKLGEQQKHRQGFLNILVELAQDAQIQSDPEKVAKVILIIDELIKYEEDAVATETQVENLRKLRFDGDFARYREKQSTLEKEVATLNSEIANAQVEITSQTNDNNNHSNNKESKINEKSLLQQTCAGEISTFAKSIDEATEFVNLVQQVIDIFRSATVENVRDVVSDIKE